MRIVQKWEDQMIRDHIEQAEREIKTSLEPDIAKARLEGFREAAMLLGALARDPRWPIFARSKRREYRERRRQERPERRQWRRWQRR
jgi:hypothetical protein